ncbi:hypothetical protein HK405_015887 [Cladochytrium tenue]|nr:hypothetical protein HK405_015887 [Cladochytrium tenue]
MKIVEPEETVVATDVDTLVVTDNDVTTVGVGVGVTVTTDVSVFVMVAGKTERVPDHDDQDDHVDHLDRDTDVAEATGTMT